MKILLTGASGFLGGIFHKTWAQKHEVIRLGRHAESEIKCDLTASVFPLPEVDMVVHAAGKAHMLPRNTAQNLEFFDVNVKGTLNLLSALEENLPRKFVLISSVSVYGLQNGENVDETYPEKATDSYGQSKLQAEKAVKEWCTANQVDFYILRLPLIAGPDAPGNLRALKRAIQRGYYFRVGLGSARRSIVSANDVANFIPTLSDHSGIYNLSGSSHPTIKEIDELLASFYNRKIHVIGNRQASWLASIGEIFGRFPFNKDRLLKLTASLTFSDLKARQRFGWNPGPLTLKDFFS